MEGTGQVGGAFERRVVMDHDGAVGGEAHVELEGVHAEVGGPLEGGEGVLGGFGGGAPVRHEGMRARVHQDVHGAAAAKRRTMAPAGSTEWIPSTLLPACQKSFWPDSSSEACLSWKSDLSA